MSRIVELRDALLRRLKEIGPISESEWMGIQPMLSYKLVRRGEFLIRAGEINTFVGYICSGLLRYFYTDPDGKEFTRYFCTAGNFVSPPGGKEGSAYFIQSIAETEILSISMDIWLELIDTHPFWARVALAAQEYALHLAERRERSLVLEDATTRYLRLLEEFPEIEHYVKQYDIASYLGITPVALSRIRGRKMPRR